MVMQIKLVVVVVVVVVESKGFIFEPSVNCKRAKSQLTLRKFRLCTQQKMTLNVGNSVVIRLACVAGAKRGGGTLSPQSPSFFLPIPYPFRRLLLRL